MWRKTKNQKWEEGYKYSSNVRATEDFIEQFCAPPCAQFFWIFQTKSQNITRALCFLPKIFSNEICSKFYLWSRAQLLPVSLRNRYKLGGDMVGKNLNIFQQDFTTLPELNITRTTHHPFGCFGPKLSNF